ncbi:MAG TPA: DUF2844 domain-containing protein [Terriglobales bacterium]|jgi:hypothetical protein|nr:DUF2844 domain-containing protein [Terriglobales bacterium]
MKTESETDKHTACSRQWWPCIALLLVLILPCSALAELGGDVASVQADQAHMKGIRRLASTAAYTLHQIQTPSGTIVREYVSPAGKVFGVAWQGPWLPDLRQLLGSYFEPYKQAAQARHTGHGPLRVEVPGLVAHSAGHMRSFVGNAYIPDLLPSGVHPEDIR